MTTGMAQVYRRYDVERPGDVFQLHELSHNCTAPPFTGRLTDHCKQSVPVSTKTCKMGFEEDVEGRNPF